MVSTHKRGGFSRFLNETTEWNILILSIGFNLIFTAFSTVQAFATSNYGNEGAMSLGILYCTFTISCLFAPTILQYISDKYAMILGASTYIIYIAANIKLFPILLYMSAALEGIGASFLWIGQGSFLTKCSNKYEINHNLPVNSELGYYNGFFFMWMSINPFIGNLGAAVLSTYQISITSIYIIFTTLCAVGVASLFLLKKMDNSKQSGFYGTFVEEEEDSFDNYKIKEIEKNPNVSFMSGILSTFNLWLDFRLQLIILTTFHWGIIITFQFGVFPTLIEKDNLRFFALSVCGAFGTIFSLSFGKLSDRFGRLPILFISTICYASVYIILYLFNIPQDEYYLFFVLAAVLGTGFVGFNTQICALYGLLFTDKTASFANSRFWSSLATTFGFLSYPYIPYHTKLIVYFILLIIGMIPVFSSSTIRQAASSKQIK